MLPDSLKSIAYVKITRIRLFVLLKRATPSRRSVQSMGEMIVKGQNGSTRGQACQCHTGCHKYRADWHRMMVWPPRQEGGGDRGPNYGTVLTDE